MSLIKSNQDQQLLRQAGQKLAEVVRFAKKEAVAGVRLIDLDRKIQAELTRLGTKSSFLGFEGFPNASCLSLNDQVVHGIPDDRILKEGDILGIDCGLWLDHVCTDHAITVPIGKVSPEAERLLHVTQAAMMAGIKAAKPFRRVGSISAAIQAVAEEAGLGIVRALTGHGVGHHVHEAPSIPNIGRVGDGALLRPGMVLAIEPMLTLGSGDVETEIDGWGIVTADHSLSAQFEHTVIITTQGAEIITK
jgi:methionyl aminopeptidase